MKVYELFFEGYDRPAKTVWQRRDGEITKKEVTKPVGTDVRPRKRFVKPERPDLGGEA